MFVRTRPLAALLLAGALLLTGCSEEEPTPKIAAEPSASPTVVKEETAEEFIRRWYSIEKTMQSDGDTAPYRALTKGCAACKTLADRVETIYAAGGEIQAGGRVSEIRPETDTQFLVTVIDDPTAYKENSSGEEQTFPGGESSYLLTLRRHGNDFRLAEFVRVER